MDRTDKKNEENQRLCPRQPVLLKATLDTGCYAFECVAYDLSLKGIRLKLDLPLQLGCMVQVMVKHCPYVPAQVIWVESGFIGLEFSVSGVRVAEILGDLGALLPKI
ncbi:MAG: PilZ domain-containing protein [Alphaproteobacteria bacterium]|nr:PilZ domain-containing protein [Alphaproteobacteria bacterium]